MRCGDAPRLYYIEAVRDDKSAFSRECQVMSFGTGWFLRETARFARCRWAVDVLDCDRHGASYMLPLGAIRLGTRLFWLVQFSGWDHELCGHRAEIEDDRRGDERVGRRVLKNKTGLVAKGLSLPLIAAVVMVAVVRTDADRPGDEPPLWDTGTFSILGYDPATGEVGGAVQSRVSRSATACSGQRRTSASRDAGDRRRRLWTAGARVAAQGMAPDAIIKQIWDEDPDPLPERWTKQGRQFAVMNARGEYAAFTGPKATEWAGHKGGKFCTAQGNILAGPAVVDNMVEAFEKTPGHLSQRLVAALEGGQAGGGDKRGQQSAALVIVKKNCGVWLHNDTVLRLQVDDTVPSRSRN